MDVRLSGEPRYVKLNRMEAQMQAELATYGERQGLPPDGSWYDCGLYYCPYYVYLVKGTKRRRLLPLMMRQACFSVDGLAGYFARTSLPPEELCEAQPPAQGTVMQPLLSAGEAWEKGREALQKSHSLSMGAGAFWLNNDLELEIMRLDLLYKPFWRIEYQTEGDRALKVTDAATGQEDSQTTYRFDQCWQRWQEKE